MAEIQNFIAQLVLFGGGGAAITFAVFKWLGEKWLEDKFARETAKLRHQYELDLERYKYEVNALYSRVTKVHEMEFDILPATWQKLLDAHGRLFTLYATKPFSPDFHSNSPQMNRDVLTATKLTPAEQSEVLQAIETLPDSDRVLALFNEKIFWHEFSEVNDAVYDFHNFVLYRKIFLANDLFVKFQEIDKLLIETLTDTETSRRLKVNMSPADVKSRRERAQPILDGIAESIQARIHFSDAK